MVYDLNYQNEQSNSRVFKEHLQQVLSMLSSFGMKNKKVVEVGCGKGVFFEMMLKEGVDCWGFDPTYEGTNERVITDYFSDKYNDINAEMIIMRHTLEHIPNPFSFIHTIAKANNYKGYLFVEVPTFDWIVEKNAFWDIFYEHCNYFTEQSISTMFNEAVTGTFFGGQYMYLWADLSKLRTTIPQGLSFPSRGGFIFQDKFDHYKEFVSNCGSMAIWGAGAKGSTFLNLLDKDRKQVSYVIDINPAKQNRHIAVTGHSIFSPAILETRPVKHILAMNEIYVNEIKEITNGKSIQLHHL